MTETTTPGIGQVCGTLTSIWIINHLSTFGSSVLEDILSDGSVSATTGKHSVRAQQLDQFNFIVIQVPMRFYQVPSLD